MMIDICSWNQISEFKIFDDFGWKFVNEKSREWWEQNIRSAVRVDISEFGDSTSDSISDFRTFFSRLSGLKMFDASDGQEWKRIWAKYD